jgi:drug/metabolite transporter (DMT)-like permease
VISREGWGAAFAIAAPVILGSSVAVSRTLTDYPLLTSQTIRYSIAAIGLWALLKMRGMRFPRPDKEAFGLLVLVALTGLVGFNILMLLALREAEPAAVGVVVGCVPILLATLGPLMSRQTPSRRVLAASVIVVAGAAIAQGGGATNLKGFLLSIGILICEAGFSLLAVPILPKLGPHAISLYVCIIAAAMMGAGAVIWDGADAFPRPSASELGAIIYLAMAVTCAAFIFWYEGISRLGVDRAGLFAGLIPISTLITAVLIGQGNLGAYQVAGVILVAVGVTFGVTAASTKRHAADEGELTSAVAHDRVSVEAR